MSVMNIDFPVTLHRRLSATAGARGVTLKAALIEAADRWVQANAHYLTELGLPGREDTNSDANEEEDAHGNDHD